MITLTGESVNELYVAACHAVSRDGAIVSPRGMVTTEVLGAHLCLTDPRRRLLDLSPARVINPAFAVAETLWILSGSDDPWIFQYNRALTRYTDDGRLQGAYGPRLRRWHGRLDQLNQVRHILTRDPDSRQAVIQMFDPEHDTRGHRDVPCTLNYRFFLRAGRLHMHTTMRSQDLWLGFPYDIFAATILQELLAGWLGVDLGGYHHYVDSLHLYDKHTDTAAGLPADPHPSQRMSAICAEWEGLSRLLSDVVAGCVPLHAGPLWRTFAAVMVSYRLWTAGDREQARTGAAAIPGELGRARVTDTPDGGRSHRRVLINGLRSRGHNLVFLQPDRDDAEAGLDLSEIYAWDVGLPEIDVLFLEWRWPIPGRNTTWCGTAGHTCDLHRQQELLDHYTRTRGTLTILWDKDRQLPTDDPLRTAGNVVVCEAALQATSGAVSLLFPVADSALAAADPAALAAMPRDLPLAYVGNQYDRDGAFDRFFAPAAVSHRHVVAGKWTRTDAWPHVSFIGRVPFAEVGEIYGRSLATVLLLPDRYAGAGQMTQRLPEAVLAGCLPLTPASIRSAERFTPRRLHVTDGADVAAMITSLTGIAGTSEHVELIAACLRALQIFRVSRQLHVLDTLLAGQPSREVVAS